MKNWLFKKCQTSWIVAGLCFGVVLGALLSLLPEPSTFSSGAMLLASVILAAVSLKSGRKIMVIAVILAGVLLGLWRGSGERVALQAYGPYIGQVVTIDGRVSEDVSYGQRGDMRVRLVNNTINEKTLTGEIWVSTSTAADIKRK